jgi:phenylalanyl-tRNA synthetase beta chain
MLLSLKWLREFVPFEGSAQELGDRLTMLGLELEELAHPYEAISSIVVGHIITCEQHPDSDHMHVCTVDAGQGELLTIVCGAPNVTQGQKVPVALVGTTMPGGLQIKKAKLRGVPSFGMICSERELGLTEDHSGIMVLPAESPVGARLVDVLDLDTEVLEIGITPNRADCLSVLGLARETALAFNLPLSLPSLPLVECGADIAGTVPLTIADPELCWLYSGRIIENVHVQPSPMRVRHRLHAVGVRPISNIVDVTNYILMELGQPLHSFDLAKLAGGITVAPAVEGEKFITLDEQERVLHASDLTIRDQRGAVALAGVMGGLATSMTAESTTVFLESALFKPAVIRKTSRRLGLSSESSYRFERGVDQLGCLRSLDRAAALMAAWSGGSVRKGVCKVEPKPFVAPVIPFRPARANALLGVELTEEFSQQTFAALGCPVQAEGDTWQVTAPSWRYDLSREADLIEEVGRVHGLDTIPPVLPQLQRSLDDAALPESPFSFWMRVKHWGKGLGLNEAVNYSFVGHKDLDHLHLPQEGRISIMNPLSAEQDALRTALAPGLLQNLRTNIAQGASGLRLFELAHVFTADASSDTTAKETSIIGFLLYGSRYDSAWPQQEADVDYSDLKGIVEHLLAFLHIGGMQCQLASEPHPYLLPCVNVLVGGQPVGVMGRVRPDMADAFHARKDVWLAELNLDMLCTLHKAASVHFSALPVFPPVRRDITVIAPATLSVQVVLDYVTALKLPLLEKINLIDLFEPEQAEERNITFRLTFRHAERTLKDAEVDKVREKIAAALVKDLPVHL